MEKAQDGDDEAFHHIYELLVDRLFNYALSHTRVRDDALDVTQDTFVELWKSFSGFRYKGKEKFLGFVFIILKRRLARHYAFTKKQNSQDAEEFKDSYEMHVEDYRHLAGTIELLSEKYKDVIKLRYWSSLSFAEIGDTLGINENTAKVTHHRALKKLGQLIEEKHHDI